MEGNKQIFTKELFSNIENPINTTCPITREEFKTDEEVGMINHSKHIFH